MQFTEEMFDEFKSKFLSAKNYEDLMGKDGAIKGLLGQGIEQLLEAEMSAHLGYSKNSPDGNNSGNSRNGYKSKQIQSDSGSLDISIPQDRNGNFEPIAVKKHQRRLGKLEDTIISLYAKGMSVSDIRRHIEDIYSAQVSEASISAITGKVMELVTEWQARTLEKAYPIIFLDAIHFKVRDNGKVITKAAYTCLGIDVEGQRDVLGLWVTENESAHYWATILSELKSRGVEELFIVCVDGLTGFKEAIESIYPKAVIQSCIVHQIRNGFKYVTHKDRKMFMEDIKKVYQAPSKEIAEQALERADELWGKKYGIVIRSWKENWHYLSQYFQFSPAIRKIIYTTNNVENLHRQFRKVTKSKVIFTNDNSLIKILYLAQKELSDRWRFRPQGWPEMISELLIHFGERLEKYLK